MSIFAPQEAICLSIRASSLARVSRAFVSSARAGMAIVRDIKAKKLKINKVLP